MNCFENITVVIPSLDPDEKLEKTVSGLIDRGFCDIITVNDGSGRQSLRHFEAISDLSQCTILTHRENLGKGAALKTAFRYILENRPHCIGVITVDGDGQHHPDDAAKLAEALILDEKKPLILGVRDFSVPDVPFRSRMGNRVSAAMFSLLCRRNITDTQTGLRAIPIEHIPGMTALDGDRFEYESNMLMALSRLDIPLREEKIRTIYIEENKTSHFKPFSDSLRITRLIFGFSVCSLLCAAADLAIFKLMIMSLGLLPLGYRTFIATFAARAISSLLNFSLNRTAVFKSGQSISRSIVRYYLLCAVQLMFSWVGVWGICAAFETGSLTAKLIVDTILFFISFFIQQNWVFSADKSTERTTVP